jgi:hypothetical protein
MAMFAYLFRRLVAIALGLALTGYSAWASWSHGQDLIGPLAAISAAVLLCFTEYARRDRQYVMAGCLLVLGLAAAAISGSIVLQRVSHGQEARTHQARSANMPRQEAQKALAEAQQALKSAQVEASDACDSGPTKACKGMEKREEAARQRVVKARSELVALGAETALDPVGGILGAHAETLRLASVLGLPLWLEISAPVVLAYGFAPGPRERQEPQPKVRRSAKKRAARKLAKQDGVVDWVEAYKQQHGRPPKIADVRQAFGVSKTTAWRRIRSAS